MDFFPLEWIGRLLEHNLNKINTQQVHIHKMVPWSLYPRQGSIDFLGMRQMLMRISRMITHQE